jgi:Domain of unknown function (DUF6484)
VPAKQAHTASASLAPSHTPERPKARQRKATPAHSVLDKVVSQSSLPARHADGIAIGVLHSLDGQGTARISLAALLGNATVHARSLVPLTAAHVGAQLAVGFEGGDTQRPIILGLMLAQAAAPEAALTLTKDNAATQPLEAVVDGQRVVLRAEYEIELRCGEAAIVLSADGHIQLRGTYITSHASATQRILGGSVNVN